MKATKTANPHAWFFAYMRDIQDSEERDEARKALIFDYSNGKTESLVELYAKYPREYNRMRQDICSCQQKKAEQMDLARKRVMKILFLYLSITGYHPTKDYVKDTARIAASADSFNKIPLIKLKQLYRIFGDKYKKKEKEWTEDTLNKIAEDVANGMFI